MNTEQFDLFDPGADAPVSGEAPMIRVVHCMVSPYDVYIGRGRDPKTNQYHGLIFSGRPGDYGNPWSHKERTLAQYRTETVWDAVLRFEEYCYQHPELIARIKQELKNKVLGCWCKNKHNPNAPCHGDILAEIANS